MANDVIGMDLVLRLDQFRAEMAKVPDIGGKEAKALTAQLSREIRGAEAAAKKAAAASADAAKKVGQMGQAADQASTNFGKAARALGPLGGVLARISPEAGAAAASVAGLTSAVEGFAGAGFAGAAAGALPVLATLGIALVAGKGWMDDYTAATKAAKDAQDQFAGALAPIDEALGAARKEHESLRAALDQTAMSSEQYLRVADLSAQVDAKEAQATRALWAEHNTLVETLEGENSLTRFEQAQAGARIRQIEREAEEIHGKANALAALTVENATLRNGIAGLAGAEDDEADASKGAAEQAARLAAMFDSVSDAAKTELDRVSALNRGIRGLLQDAESTRVSALEGEARLTAEYEAQTKAIGEKTQALLLASSGELERTNAQLASKQALAALDEKYFQDLDALREEDKARALADAEDKAAAESAVLAQSLRDAGSVASSSFDAVSATFGRAYDEMADSVSRLESLRAASEEHLTAGQLDALDERIEAEKDAARKAWENQQAAAMASAAVNTFLSVSEALASAPPPFNLAAAGVALAGGVAQEAAIATVSPPFHSGGPLDLAPDEMSVTARRGEYILSPTGRQAIGDETLRRADAGQAPAASSGAVVAVSVYKHTRQVDRWKTDGLLAGDPIAKAIAAGKLVGHRTTR